MYILYLFNFELLKLMWVVNSIVSYIVVIKINI